MTVSPPSTSASALAGLANDSSVQKLRGALAGLRRQLSRRVLLVDFSDGCAVLAQCRLRRGSVELVPIDITVLPADAVDKGCPAEPEEMAELLRSVLTERQVVAQRAAVVLPANAFTTMSLCIDADLTADEALQQLGEPGSGVQLPFPRQQADLALVDISDPEKKQTAQQRSYLLMAVQRSLIDRLVATFAAAGLELQFVDSGLIAPLRLLNNEIASLAPTEQLLHLNLAAGFTSCTTVWRGGPQKFQRMAPVRPYPLSQHGDAEEYFPITPEDLISLLRDLRKLIKGDANTTSLITLGGASSGHPGIADLLEDALELPVRVVYPLQHPKVGNFDLPAGYNPQLLSRIVGMSLRCLHTEEHAAELSVQAVQTVKTVKTVETKETEQSWLHCLKARIKSNIGR